MGSFRIWEIDNSSLLNSTKEKLAGVVVVVVVVVVMTVVKR
jgi:hypothetical protein